MTRSIAVLRPEPGNRVTATAIEAAGRHVIRMPLFATRPIAWEVPEPKDFDALLLTSANALRHGGKGLLGLGSLPVYAVGAVTAEAARRLGFAVEAAGEAGAEMLLREAERRGVRRALHLGGRERTIERGGIVRTAIIVYASETIPIAPGTAARLNDAVVLVQSARAASRLAQIVEPPHRRGIALVAVSAAAAQEAGAGWETVRIAAAPSNEAVIDAALALPD